MGDPGIKPASNGHLPDPIHQKYAQERDKRLRADGDDQFVPIPSSEKFARFAADPWDAELIEAQRSRGVRSSLPDGSHTKILIVGAGYGGMLFAVRLLEAGFSVDDLLIVDSAGGFGGTWYWNRYPGLMCDVESYIYMPLLEETGYMPKHKYAAGNELREYGNAIAEKWDLYRAAAFKTLVKGMKWDDAMKNWEVDMMQEQPGQGGGGTGSPVTVRADFVILASGLLNIPKLPKLSGIEKFQGHSFHTSRWDYAYTGGSTEDPSLTNLKDKKVGIVGTGATAIQAVPRLAKWAKELYVFQRTPSAVDVRDNRETDREWWDREVASRGKGWQKERRKNYNSFISNETPRPESDMVSDGWTKMTSYSVLVGGPNNQTPDFLPTVHKLDLARQERVRARVDDIVKDETTASSLKAWYSGWCKRPCFHDEYLPSFNKSNVTLVDTDGRGISRVSERGLVVNDTDEYDLDLIIFSTGFRLAVRESPGSRAGLSVTGRAGEDMDHKWVEKGVSTLHGFVSRDFPNLFYPGPNQTGSGPNQSSTLDASATHIAYIISQTAKKAAESGSEKVSVEPTSEAEETWSMEIVSRAKSMAAVAGCTPGYLNGEGMALDANAPMEQKLKMARMGNWGEGVNSFVAVIDEWRNKGDMEGLEINCRL